VRRALARTRGAKAALRRFREATGINGDSATRVLPYHDEVRGNPIDTMHGGAVSGLRIISGLTGQGDRIEPLLDRLALDTAVAGREAGAADPAAPAAAPPPAAPPLASKKRAGAGSKKRKEPASAAGKKAAAKRRQQALTSSMLWEYTSIIAHRDDEHGERELYHVRWPGEVETWEPAVKFTADVERCEGPINTVTMYELGLVREVPGIRELHARFLRNRPLREEQSVVTASVGRSRAIRLPDPVLAQMDVALNRLPYNPETIPWRARHPMTHPSRLKMHDVHNLTTSTTLEFQLRGQWEGEDTGRILTRWLRANTDVYAPVVTQRTINNTEAELFEAASEVEVVMPQTDQSILFGHSICHFPDQQRYLGPASTHDMWGFEGCILTRMHANHTHRPVRVPPQHARARNHAPHKICARAASTAGSADSYIRDPTPRPTLQTWYGSTQGEGRRGPNKRKRARGRVKRSIAVIASCQSRPCLWSNLSCSLAHCASC